MTWRGFPEVTGLKEIQALSYWRYVRLRQCLLSGAYPAAVEVEVRPKPMAGKAQVLGQVYHLAMERLQLLKKAGNLSVEGVRTAFFEVVGSEEKRVQSENTSRHLGELSNWAEIGIIYDSVMDLARRTLTSTSSSEDKTEIYTEETVYSNDGVLFGQIDAFFVGANGIDLVDYKSGRISDEHGLKAEYVDQLYFYAQLISEKFGRYPRSLTLKTRDNESVEVRPDPERSLRLSQEMRAVLGTYNRMVREKKLVSDFAVTSRALCSWCDAKVVCPAFWSEGSKLGIESGYHALRGRQMAPLKRARLGGASMLVEVLAATFPGKEATVSRIFEARFPAFVDRVGQLFVLTGLKRIETLGRPVVELSERSLIVPVEGSP